MLPYNFSWTRASIFIWRLYQPSLGLIDVDITTRPVFGRSWVLFLWSTRILSLSQARVMLICSLFTLDRFWKKIEVWLTVFLKVVYYISINPIKWKSIKLKFCPNHGKADANLRYYDVWQGEYIKIKNSVCLISNKSENISKYAFCLVQWNGLKKEH